MNTTSKQAVSLDEEEFEDFGQESWNEQQMDQADETLWDASWDDDDSLINDSFTKQLRGPLRKFSSTTSKLNDDGVASKAKTIVKNILHGDKTKLAFDQTYSKLLERGKFVHEKQVHSVKPEAWDDYVGLVSEQYSRISNDPQFDVRLFGSFETEIGTLDTAFHIWEYKNYPGYTKTTDLLRSDQQFIDFQKKLRSMINKRETQMLLEFSFWDPISPSNTNGIYELRSYVLKPGRLLEWELEWRKGLEARRQFVEPVGAWFSQIGELNTVHHMWRYPNLQVRKKMREAAWQVDGWASTVSATVKLIDRMECQILRPMPFSPLL